MNMLIQEQYLASNDTKSHMITESGLWGTYGGTVVDGRVMSF